MGTCFSSSGGAPIITNNDGDEEAFHSKYLEDRVLGEGEFGTVKLCHDMQAEPGDENQQLAVKILRKGMTFKDNTLYSPIKPETLKMECSILQTLHGKHYCLGIKGIYETPKLIFVVTEYCSGGEMMEYVSKYLKDELHTEDVSRIIYQLLSAIHHCATHHIIHRDIKPENCMFRFPTSQSELRLIDFGSGTMNSGSTTTTNDIMDQEHTTFAGSAFYISPEMFQRTYTYKTDVWSAGVVLYVLVAGYPAEQLQKAFNLLQKSKARDLRALPNLPSNLPDSYYDLLNQLLTYRHKQRPSAGDLLQHEFVQFHKKDMTNGTTTTSTTTTTTPRRLAGSVQRHSMFLDYQKYERAVTTILATVLNREEFGELVLRLQKQCDTSEEHEELEIISESGRVKQLSNVQKLKIIPMNQLKEILRDMKQERCIDMMEALPNAKSYDTFAYHIALLKEFERSNNTKDKDNGGGMKRSMSISGSMSNKNEVVKGEPNSVHGNDVYGRLKAQGNVKKGARARDQRRHSDKLASSWHLGPRS